MEVTIQSLNHCKEKEGKIRIHFWHPNVSSLNLSTSCCAMLPHVPNLFSASDGAARRSLSHSAQVLGGVRDRCRRRSDRFASGGVFYLAGSPDVGPTGPAVACLIPVPRWQSVGPFYNLHLLPSSSKFYRVTASISCNACIIFKSDFNSWITGIKKMFIKILKCPVRRTHTIPPEPWQRYRSLKSPRLA